MANQFKRTVGKAVDKKECLSWIDMYQKDFPGETRSVFYGRDVLEKILSDPGVSGISFFFCRKINESGKTYNDLVLVGTYEDGTLVWSKGNDTNTMRDPGGGHGFDNGIPCPPTCPTMEP